MRKGRPSAFPFSFSVPDIAGSAILLELFAQVHVQCSSQRFTHARFQVFSPCQGRHIRLFLRVDGGMVPRARCGPRLQFDRGSHARCGCGNATTYRFYVNMMEAGDRMSAVFGNSTTPLGGGGARGAFNTPQNGSWNAVGLTPALFPLFPELQDDTYATIRLTGPASFSGLDNAADPQMAVDDAQPEVFRHFSRPTVTRNLRADSEIGTVWFVLNDASNALPDESMRVLIMQDHHDWDCGWHVEFSSLARGTSWFGHRRSPHGVVRWRRGVLRR